ncbi:hypothetical protein [Acaryochloris thomasi]|nr:hypothetical protein [Acaryochloris thomasi]
MDKDLELRVVMEPLTPCHPLQVVRLLVREAAKSAPTPKEVD